MCGFSLALEEKNSLKKTDFGVVYTCDLRTWEVEARGSEVQCHLQLQKDYEASLGITEIGAER